MDKSDSFYSLETIGGILLFFTAVIAIIIANSPYQEIYNHFLMVKVTVGSEDLFIKKPLFLWVNDGLMAIYFLLIGLEIKREIKRGVLNNSQNIIVPAITAFCGLVFPALIFIAFNYYNPVYIKGWAIPTATDIAFTLGIISLFSKRVPLSLKVLLTTIAIFDDIAAIVIIALFYTRHLSGLSLLFAFCFTLILIALNQFGCKRPSVFIVVGIALWAAVLKSGVHATLAGIIIAMTIPDKESDSMLQRMENGLHPWIIFFILPFFAFVNAGVTFIDTDPSSYIHPIVLGVGLGLFLGKQLGIFIPLSYFVKFNGFLKEDNVNFKQIYGIALICGVGFTMSLFIGSLAYKKTELTLMPLVKIGVILGSFASGLLGYLVLRTSLNKKNSQNQ